MEESILKFFTKFAVLAGYPLMILLVLLTLVWASERVKESQFNFFSWIKTERLSLLCALAICILNFVSDPPRFRVLSDQANLASTAQSLIETQSVHVIYSQWEFYGLKSPINYEYPSRSILYPFVVAIAHLLTGERLMNGFVVNAIFYWITLSMILIYFRRRGFLSLGWVTILLWMAHPVLSDNASGGGYDLLSALLFVGSLLLFRAMVLDTTLASVALLLCFLGLFSHCRQESPAAAAILGGATLLWSKARIQLKEPKLRWTLAGLVLTSLPIILAKVVLENPYLYYDPARPTSRTFADAFTPGYFSSHSWKFWDFLFTGLTSWSWKVSIPYSFLSFWLGFLFFAIAIWFQWQRGWEHWDLKSVLKDERKFYRSVTLVAFLGLNWLYFSHYRGLFDSLTEARFFLIWALGFAFLVARTVMMAPKPRKWIPPLLTGAAAIFILEHTAVIPQRYTNLLFIVRGTEKAKEAIPRLRPDPTFVIYNRSNIFLTDGYSSADFMYFNQNVDAIANQIRRHLISKVYAVQLVDYVTKATIDGTTLDPKYHLKPIYEFAYNDESKQVISEVSVDP